MTEVTVGIFAPILMLLIAVMAVERLISLALTTVNFVWGLLYE